MVKIFLAVAALNGLMAVVFGAFGAHALKGQISDHLLAAFRTATDYQMYHALALMGLAILMLQLSVQPKIFGWVAWLWIVGVLLFSGSLYGLSLGGPNWLGPITPIGGMLLISAWVLLAIGAWQLKL